MMAMHHAVRSHTLQIAITIAVVALAAACKPPTPAALGEHGMERGRPLRNTGSEYGSGCNRALLEGPFALSQAPDFAVSTANEMRIHQVIDELRRGYGGTLVTSPPDAAIDSPAFLAHYLRAFSDPVDADDYDYRFERILERLSKAETVLDDPRLDWDMWRSYVIYEGWVASGRNANEYESTSGDVQLINRLDAAKDLLWWYLSRNADAIRKDEKRLNWWLTQLTDGLREAGGRPMRRWFLLQLVAATDTKTVELIDEDADAGDEWFPVRRSDPFDPFLEVEDASWLFGEDRRRPPFLEVLAAIARSQRLTYEVWGVDPKTMPATKAVSVNLALRGSQISFAGILCQESWSKTPQDFSVSLCRPIGRRSRHSTVSLTTADSDDGVFFFTYDARLYVWPKKEMDNAVIAMLRMSGLIGEADYAQYLARGFKKLAVTARSDG